MCTIKIPEDPNANPGLVALKTAMPTQVSWHRRGKEWKSCKLVRAAVSQTVTVLNENVKILSNV